MAQEDLGIIALVEESTDTADYSGLIFDMVEQDCDVIITVGYMMQEDTLIAAYQHPGFQFIGVEQDYIEYPSNLTVLYFHEDRGGFLMGVLSAMNTQTGQVCAICGPSIFPLFWRYCEGFRAGVSYQDSSIQSDVIYYDGEISEAFFDSNWTTEQALMLADGGCDRFFVAFPLSGDAAFEQLSDLSMADHPLLGMGIESDMYESLPSASSILLSSAVKRYDLGVYMLVDMAMRGELEGYQIYGEMDYAPLRNLPGNDAEVISDRLDEVLLIFKEGRLDSGVSDTQP